MTEFVQANQSLREDPRGTMLVQWVTTRTDAWEDYREQNFKSRWDDYYSLWRGIYTHQGQNPVGGVPGQGNGLAHTRTPDRASERSKLISPALSQAIEVSVAELEEAVFGRGMFFDLKDDVLDDDKNDLEKVRVLLAEDFEWADVRTPISEAMLNGAIYGTGIGKIVVDKVAVQKTQITQVEDSFSLVRREAVTEERFRVSLISIPPDEFVCDPSARTVDEALGCAHITLVPMHSVQEKQDSGVYFRKEVPSTDDWLDTSAKGESRPPIDTDTVKITEWHGLIPKSMLPSTAEMTEEDELEQLLSQDVTGVENEDGTFDSAEMVEGIVTIANGTILLRAVENPYMMKDRSIIAFQYDTVPNRFWGRGISEKGYNPQKALDAELRGRIDAMALSIHPMMGVDASRMPRGSQLTVRPGKTIFTNGDPNEVLRPFNFGQVNPVTFSESGELERMVQVGTGSMDSASPAQINSRNTTSGGMSMINNGMIKRTKRTLANFNLRFLEPFVQKAALRYMEFEDERYPLVDPQFKAQGTLGLVARELEQQQLAQLLQTVPPGTDAYWIILESFYENSSLTNRQELVESIQAMRDAAKNPQPPQPTIEEQIKMQELQATTAKDAKKLQLDEMRVQIEQEGMRMESARTVSDNIKKETEAMLNIAKAEAEEVGRQLNVYQAALDRVETNAITFVRDAGGQLIRSPDAQTSQGTQPTGTGGAEPTPTG